MLKLLGIDNPAVKALIGAVLVIVGIGVHGWLLTIVGAVLVTWGLVGLAGTLRGRER